MAVGSHGSVEIKGLRELGAALSALPPRVATNVARGATAAASATIRDTARDKAARYAGTVAQGHPPPGTLKRAIVLKRITERCTPLFQMFYVVVKHGKEYQKQGKKGTLSQDAFYWHMVEFGTSKMGARPFLRPAFEQSKDQALADFKDYLVKRLPDEVAKLNLPGLTYK